MTRIVLSAVLSVAVIASCGKDEGGDDKSGKTGDDTAAKKPGDSKTPPPAKKADPGAWVDLEMPKLGLVASAPGNAKVGAMGGIRSADWKCSLSVFEKSKMTPSFDNWVTNIEKGNKGGKLKEMSKKDKTDDDNFELQWTTESGKFGYVKHRKIGDKVYSCVNFQADSEEKRACTIKMCESLKAK